jgi:four helix bundle protein
MEESRKVRHYRDLMAWQKAMDLVELVYGATRGWPKDEIYGLTNQIRRAVVSVPSNIAEGQGRNSPKEFMHHLSIARGSLLEVETQALIAQRLGYIPSELAERILSSADDVSRLISGLARYLATH